MHCSSCADTIADAVESVDGVESASVNYATDGATVEYDDSKASLSEIYGAIERVGYEPRRERRTVEVAGMHCASCSETIEEALSERPGVVAADVNYATDEATVEYNPESVSLEAPTTPSRRSATRRSARTRPARATGRPRTANSRSSAGSSPAARS